MAPRKSSLFDTATTVGKIMSFLGVSALCGLLAAGLIFPLAATGGAAASAGSDVLDDIPAELTEEPLSTPSHIYANDGETLIATFYAENRVPVSYDEISQEMKDAIIAIEDERFYEHGGVDGQGVARAAINNSMSSQQQGASTLTMQYVNNVLNNAAVVRGEGTVLGSFAQEKTYADKLREMKLAVSVEQEMTKEEILTGYLNIIMLGGRNYGVEAAAQYYWDVPASELNVQQSATLAGMVQSPNYYKPDDNPEAALERRNTVLGTMLRNDFITEEEYEEAYNSDLGLVEGRHPDDGCVEANLGHYFCNYVETEFLANSAFGETEEDRRNLLNRGGLSIVTTLDADLQLEAEDTVWAHRPTGSGAAAMLNSMDPETGNILAMAQSTRFDPDVEGTDNTSVNFNVGTSHNGGTGFPGGSILKPFIAAAWIEEGGSMDDRVDAWETEYAYGEEWEASCQPGGTSYLQQGDDPNDDWTISNVMDGTEREMTVDWGLFYSINTATVATAYDMDLCAITDVTDRLQLTDETGEGLSTDTPSFILGSASITPIEMNRAYAAFANDGVLCEPRALLSVTDSQGNEYDVPATNCEEVINPDVIAQVNDTLINIAEQPDPVSGDPPFPMAGKTGTNHTASAMSFQGYTEGIATSAYVARFDDNLSMWENGNVPDESYAGSVAFPMWYDYMSEVGGAYPTGDFREASDSPFDDRREGYGGRYSRSELGSGGGSGNSSNNNSSDSDDDDDDD